MKAVNVVTRCNNCERQTTQKILFNKQIKQRTESEGNNYERFAMMTLECNGCKTVSFLKRSYIADLEFDGKTGYIDDHYPNEWDEYLDNFNFLHYNDQHDLPRQLFDLYEEIKTAFENSSDILAGIGLRTMVEAICNHQNIKGRNLQDKIKNLHLTGLISSAELPILDKLRLMGNLSAHQVKAFSLDKLNYALDIVNHVLKSIYILPKINRKLKFN